ncbi:MAG: glycosyltransferase family 4 protein [Parvularculaceae bacterium]
MSAFSPPILALPADAAAAAREALGLGPSETIRIAYLPGPGDLRETYRYWRRGEHDPRLPKHRLFDDVFRALSGAWAGRGAASYPRPRARACHEEPGFEFVCIPYRTRPGAASYYLGRFAYARDCLKALKGFRPHVAVIASDFDWQAMPLVRGAAGKVILSLHNTYWPMGLEQFGLGRRAANLPMAAALGSIDAAVCTSNECDRQLRRLLGRDLPSFVAVPQQAARLPAPPPPAERPSRLLYLGRVEEPKGVFDLLDAFEGLRRTRPSLSLVYAGGGGALPALRDEIARRNLADAVKTPGHLDQAGAKDALAQADILVCPTRSSFLEGLAFVCFEAAVHGAPTVMSSVVPAA